MARQNADSQIPHKHLFVRVISEVASRWIPLTWVMLPGETHARRGAATPKIPAAHRVAVPAVQTSIAKLLAKSFYELRCQAPPGSMTCSTLVSACRAVPNMRCCMLPTTLKMTPLYILVNVPTTSGRSTLGSIRLCSILSLPCFSPTQLLSFSSAGRNSAS